MAVLDLILEIIEILKKRNGMIIGVYPYIDYVEHPLYKTIIDDFSIPVSFDNVLPGIIKLAYKLLGQEDVRTPNSVELEEVKLTDYYTLFINRKIGSILLYFDLRDFIAYLSPWSGADFEVLIKQIERAKDFILKNNNIGAVIVPKRVLDYFDVPEDQYIKVAIYDPFSYSLSKYERIEHGVLMEASRIENILNVTRGIKADYVFYTLSALDVEANFSNIKNMDELEALEKLLMGRRHSLNHAGYRNKRSKELSRAALIMLLRDLERTAYHLGGDSELARKIDNSIRQFLKKYKKAMEDLGLDVSVLKNSIDSELFLEELIEFRAEKVSSGEMKVLEGKDLWRESLLRATVMLAKFNGLPRVFINRKESGDLMRKLFNFIRGKPEGLDVMLNKIAKSIANTIGDYNVIVPIMVDGFKLEILRESKRKGDVKFENVKFYGKYLGLE